MNDDNKTKIFEEKIIQEWKISLNEIKKGLETEKFKKKYFGKEGMISLLFKQIAKETDLIKKKFLGKLVNQWKNELVDKIKNFEIIDEKTKKQEISKVDIYQKGIKILLGNLHPITQIIQTINNIFIPFGYKIIESPEIETEEYNFDKLNMPFGHPARNIHDTFYLYSSSNYDDYHMSKNKFLLRTHTSNTQVRTMEENINQELKVITVGKVYRRDEDDNVHTHQFTQLEGFRIGKGISFAHLKGILELVLKKLFGNQCIFRFRHSYFPFTEPSVEVDIQCVKCYQKGCSICKKSGWIEVLGAGLIHPRVLKNCGFNTKKFTGFAFGLGIERLLMIKLGIEDIRHFYNNNILFLKQFKNL